MDAHLVCHVDHVQRNHDRLSQLDKLCGQVQVTLQVGSILDIDDHIGTFVNNGVTSYHFVQRTGGQTVRARQIQKQHVNACKTFMALFAFHRDTGIVAHMLTRPGEIIENRRFAAVWIARQRNFNRFHLAPASLRKSSRLLPCVKIS